MRQHPKKSLPAAVLVFSTLALASCTTMNVDGALSNVNTLVEERTKKSVTWYRDDASRGQADYTVRQLLSQPLTIDGAIQIAFLRNPAIQVSLANIGIAEADVAQAGRMRNPILSIERLVGGGILDIERQLLFNVLSLFTIGSRTEIAKDQAERARYMSALEIVKSADGVRRAWIEAVSARESIHIIKRIYTSVKTAENLGMRMAAAGSMPPLNQAKLKVAKAEVAGQLGAARTAANMAREKLIRQMGVWGKEIKFALPSRLPGLAKQPKRLRNIERTALTKRLDIQAARKEIDVLKKTLGLTRFTGVVNLLEISGIANKEREADGEKSHLRGFEVEIAIPIFDPGDIKVSRAKFVYMQSVEQLKSLAINARSEVREAYSGYRGAYDLARHYQRTIVPLNQTITDQELLRYNGMLTGILQLLDATRQQQSALLKTLGARRDFWLADAQLNYVLFAGSSSGASINIDVASSGGSKEEH